MTTFEPGASLAAGTAPRDASRWARCETALIRASEHLNPILIKESRQALKSRQFLVTFSLLLLLAWIWSLLGIALLMPGVYYASGGRFMLVGYYLVLALPLLIVVPFSAFRSIATEQEDGTYELLSITNLSARQIITGKLGSAVLQILVYFSALSPCIAFTYLLRGLDVFAILLMLGYAFVASLSLSILGLLCGTLTRSRHWQTLLSVLFLIGLGAFTLLWCQFTAMIFFSNMPVDESGFWIANLAVISVLASFMVLGVYAAASQLGFASDNRSTRLRVIMMVQQILFIGWMTYAWLLVQQDEVLQTLIGVAAAYWLAMGTLLIGEFGQLSPRARRALPSSFLGRATLTWLNPGAGTGYLFAVSNLFTVVAVYLLLLLGAELTTFSNQPRPMGWAMFASLLLAYVALFLGVGRLILLGLRAVRMTAGMLTSVVLQLAMLVLTVGGPYFLAWWSSGFGRVDYSILQSVNWLWTLQESLSGMNRTSDTAWPVVGVVPVGFVAVAIVWSAGIIIFAINLLLTRRDVQVVRVGTPGPVTQDDEALRPRLPKPISPPTSPFDDDVG